ncbi:hypothetical protein ACFSKT_29155 [Paenibacillus xanthanilyticus]|uniref:hypothetical protein n=1 Tax=Paenibacillus xanthanilyticus TaxID=1783531 RepID=UPI0036290213
MSHYAEVLKEQRAIDALLADGYRITRISEDMDGSAVSFAKAAPSDERAELQLLTADARKYVVTLLFARMRAGGVGLCAWFAESLVSRKGGSGHRPSE